MTDDAETLDARTLALVRAAVRDALASHISAVELAKAQHQIRLGELLARATRAEARVTELEAQVTELEGQLSTTYRALDEVIRLANKRGRQLTSGYQPTRTELVRVPPSPTRTPPKRS